MKIILNGMRFHSFHGYYSEEQSVGNEYEIDLEIVILRDAQEMHDHLEKTVNYESLYAICKEEMSKPYKLIETVADQILKNILAKFEAVTQAKILLRKCNPLLGGIVASAAVELSKQNAG